MKLLSRKLSWVNFLLQIFPMRNFQIKNNLFLLLIRECYSHFRLWYIFAINVNLVNTVLQKFIRTLLGMCVSRNVNSLSKINLNNCTRNLIFVLLRSMFFHLKLLFLEEFTYYSNPTLRIINIWNMKVNSLYCLNMSTTCCLCMA